MMTNISHVRFAGAFIVQGENQALKAVRTDLEQQATSEQIDMEVYERPGIFRFYTEDDADTFRQKRADVDTYFQLDDAAKQQEKTVFDQLLGRAKAGFNAAMRSDLNEVLATINHRKSVNADDVLFFMLGIPYPNPRFRWDVDSIKEQMADTGVNLTTGGRKI